jgi:hypothetical protein
MFVVLDIDSLTSFVLSPLFPVFVHNCVCCFKRMIFFECFHEFKSFYDRCKKYPSMELRGLFQYLVNQLKRGQGIELVLLQVLLLCWSFLIKLYHSLWYESWNSKYWSWLNIFVGFLGAYPTNGKCSVHREFDWGTAGGYGREWDSEMSCNFFWDDSE